MLGFTNTTNVTLVLSQSAEGLEPEELENFGKAWAEALSLCLERTKEDDGRGPLTGGGHGGTGRGGGAGQVQ